MNLPPSKASGPATDSSELDALLSAIAEAIQALESWDVTAFEGAVARQRAICKILPSITQWHQLPDTAAKARAVKEATRVYHRLLQHSIHWARVINAIFQAGGNPYPCRSSVRFKG
ncbi:MAG: hypothetical protein CXZ00_13525 [Acidobacteria bacterium]|nr:MAG: hypothetical protein CXZ00_13525 [Acidobacteriota bacterium]